MPPVDSEHVLVAYQEALRRGHQALLAGKPREALSEYKRAIDLAGDRPLPHLSLGRALMALDRPADALAAFGRARDRATTDPAALRGMADALIRLGRISEADKLRAEIERLAQAPRPGAADVAAEAVLPRAEVLTIAAERAWHDRRTDTAVEQWLAASRAHAADGHLDAALDVCQRALLADAGEPRVQLELCRLYVARGWREQAIERMLLLGRLMELDPRPEVRRGLAELARSEAAAEPQLAALAEQMETAPPA